MLRAAGRWTHDNHHLAVKGQQSILFPTGRAEGALPHTSAAAAAATPLLSCVLQNNLCAVHTFWDFLWKNTTYHDRFYQEVKNEQDKALL